jgi:hypothetical protein
MYPNFDNMFNGFKEELMEMTKSLESSQSKITNISTDNTLSTIFSMLLNAIDPLIPKAINLSPKEVTEVSEYLELGSTKDYCPVTLKRKHVLQKGVQQFVSKFKVGPTWIQQTIF